MKKNLSIFEELKTFFRKEGITQAEIARRLGVSTVVVNMMLNGKRNFGKNTAMRWGDEFGLSTLWLMTGEGPMLAGTGEGSIATPPVYYAPLVSKYAYAGYIRGWGDEEYLDTLPKYPFFVDHDPRGKYFAIEVKGDSMDDGSDRSIKEGSICLCRLVEPELYKDAALHLKKWVFVVVTDEGILIKRIKAHDVKSGVLILESINPAYTDMEISLNNVKAVLNVVQVTHAPIL